MKILVIRLSSIGDIVLTEPVRRVLAQQVGASVHVLTKPSFADLVRFDPHVAAVHTFSGDGLATLRQLRAECFDAVVDLHDSLRSAWLTRLLGRPTLRYRKHRVARWARVALRLDRLPTDHVVDRYLAAVAPLGASNDGQGVALHIPPARAVPVDQRPLTHRGDYVALAIGAAHATKRMPTDRWIEAAQRIAGPLVVVGGPGDAPAGAAIAAALGARVWDATGQFDLLGSASLLRDSAAVVAHDSAAMHIACAFRRPVVSIWGSTIPGFGMGPYQPQTPERTAQLEVGGLACRPCCTIGKAACPAGHFACMTRHDPAAIASAVTRLRREALV